jgi:Tol biopolymer transport system component/DNA-binding winged helix-turn-helix (wHTH) protein
MNSAPANSRGFRFGLFEVDIPAGELRRRGRKVPIQEQPFQVLLTLLRSPGEVVTREELQRSLWPADTFVDFELGLNTAVKKIRRALGDSAEHPRYIETLPRKGYRFIAPVETLRESPAVPTRRTPQPALRQSRRWIWLGVLASLAGIALVAWWRIGQRAAPVAAPADRFRLTQLTRDSGFTGQPDLSPDGKLIAYASDRAQGNLDIWVQQIGGSSAVRLSDHPSADYHPSFSPDGRHIVFRSDRDGGGIYVVPTLGGDVRRVAPEGFQPQFSPDGRWISYLTGAPGGFSLFRTFLVPSEGGRPRQIRPEFKFVAQHVWIPNGNLLFAGEHPDGRWDLWVTSVGGDRLVQTYAGQVLQQQKLRLSELNDWASPGYLIFSAQTGDSVNLWRLFLSPRTWKAEGPAERLTFGITELSARAGPGERLVFSSATRRAAIWGLPVHADRGVPAGPLRRLTDSGASDSGPDISADGKTLVFRSNRSGSAEIWSRDLAAGREVNVTANSLVFETMPAISRDGQRIAYEPIPPPPSKEPRRRMIVVVPSVGGSPETVCDDCGAPAMWSADGKQILYLRSEPPRSSVHLLDLLSRKSRLLIHHPDVPVYVPRFSPDERWLVFKGDLDERRTRLFIAPLPPDRNVRPDEWIPISEGQAWDDLPRWSPNGRLIYFTSNRDGFRCLWARRIHPQTRQPEDSPFAVFHIHEAHLSMVTLSLAELQLSLARDLLVFPLAELRGNIWMMEPGEARTSGK